MGDVHPRRKLAALTADHRDRVRLVSDFEKITEPRKESVGAPGTSPFVTINPDLAVPFAGVSPISWSSW